MVLLSEDPEGQNKKLKEVADEQEIKNTPLTTFDGVAGPPEYKISKDADITVMMWVGGKVVVNQPLFDNYVDAKVIPPPPRTPCPPPPQYVHYVGFGSFHGDIINFALADASCRSISKGIDRELFMKLSTRAGRERIDSAF